MTPTKNCCPTKQGRFNWKYLKWLYRAVMLFGFGCAYYSLTYMRNAPDFGIIAFGVVGTSIFTVVRWLEEDRGIMK